MKAVHRLLCLLGAVVVLVVFPALPAQAHVRATSNDAAPGGYGLITFRVPTESDTASTTGLVIELPADAPITSVSVQPVPGWSAKLERRQLTTPIQTNHGEVDNVVSQITWTADSEQDGIAPGQFQQFSISAGPLPETDRLVFPTDQLYSDGSTVSWDEISDDPSVEPDHPAPALDLTGSATTPTAAADTTVAEQSGPSWTGITALVVAGLALIAALIAVLRTRQPR